MEAFELELEQLAVTAAGGRVSNGCGSVPVHSSITASTLFIKMRHANA